MGQRPTILLGTEAGRRSRSFTEGKTTPSHTLFPPSHPGWNSSLATPLTCCNHGLDETTSLPHQSLQNDVTATDKGPDGVFKVLRQPRQRLTSNDSLLPELPQDHGPIIKNRPVDTELKVTVSRAQLSESLQSGPHSDDVFGGSDKASDVDGGRINFDKLRREISVKPSRDYKDARDPYDSDYNTASDSLNNNSSNQVNSEQVDQKTKTKRNPSLKAECVSSDNFPSGTHTFPRERPTTLFISQSSATSSFSNEELNVSKSDDCKPLSRYICSGTLGRKPRGPILTHFQRTRSTEKVPLISSPKSPSESSPSRKSDDCVTARKSLAGSQQSFRPGISVAVTSSRHSSSGIAQRRSNLPTAVSPNRHSSAGSHQNLPTAASPNRHSSPGSHQNLPTAASPNKYSSAGSHPNPLKSLSTSNVFPKCSSNTEGSPESFSNIQSPSRSFLNIESHLKSSPKTPRSPKTFSNVPKRSSQNLAGSLKRPGLNIPVSFKPTSGPLQGFQLTSGHPARSTTEQRTPDAQSWASKQSLAGNQKAGKKGEEIKKAKEGRKPLTQPMTVMELPATDLQSPAMHGYLHRKTFSDQWVRYWYVLQDRCLYCYLTPDDRVTVDVTELDGYTVTLLEDQFPGQRFVLHLENKDYIPVYLATPSREDLEGWNSALRSAIQAMCLVNGLDPKLQESEGAVGGAVSEERVLVIKQKLLSEVLRQKAELEKRLASKHKQSNLEGTEVVPTSITPTGEQICTLTRLRQRRLSAQIKMDTLQRQFQSNGHSKKSRFTFGKKKSSAEGPPSPHDPDIAQQIKTLSDDLSAIERDLAQNGGVMTLDRKFSKGRKQSSGMRYSQDLETAVLDGSVGVKNARVSTVDNLQNEDAGMGRSNSLKSSMQKLAHKTLAKAAWYRSKKTSQEGSIDKDDGVDDKTSETHHPPDVVDLTHRLERAWPARDSSLDSEEGAGETYLPPPSSFDSTDSPSPVSSPRSPRSIGSGASDRDQQPFRYHDDLKPPRRQVDPNAVANIEAFEEMSRQVLGEAPT